MNHKLYVKANDDKRKGSYILKLTGQTYSGLQLQKTSCILHIVTDMICLIDSHIETRVKKSSCSACSVIISYKSKVTVLNSSEDFPHGAAASAAAALFLHHHKKVMWKEVCSTNAAQMNSGDLQCVYI